MPFGLAASVLRIEYFRHTCLPSQSHVSSYLGHFQPVAVGCPGSLSVASESLSVAFTSLSVAFTSLSVAFTSLSVAFTSLSVACESLSVAFKRKVGACESFHTPSGQLTMLFFVLCWLTLVDLIGHSLACTGR
jgi:hypothetical protein